MVYEEGSEIILFRNLRRQRRSFINLLTSLMVPLPWHWKTGPIRSGNHISVDCVVVLRMLMCTMQRGPGGAEEDHRVFRVPRLKGGFRMPRFIVQPCHCVESARWWWHLGKVSCHMGQHPHSPGRKREIKAKMKPPGQERRLCRWCGLILHLLFVMFSILPIVLSPRSWHRPWNSLIFLV